MVGTYWHFKFILCKHTGINLFLCISASHKRSLFAVPVVFSALSEGGLFELFNFGRIHMFGYIIYG